MNWINSWKKGNKKNKLDIKLRFGMLTIFELHLCFKMCEKSRQCKKMRFMILNFGFEI